MPIYEYRCQQCDADFEQLVRGAPKRNLSRLGNSRSSKDKVKCPKCASPQVHRKPSVFAMSSSNKGSDQSSAGSSCTSCRATSCVGCRK